MDSLPIRLHPSAAIDVEKGRAWYEERNPIVADAFLAEVDRAMAVIAEAPDRWPHRYGRFRYYVLPDFPYTIFYLDLPHVVHVIAVAADRRKPGYWKRRSPRAE